MCVQYFKRDSHVSYTVKLVEHCVLQCTLDIVALVIVTLPGTKYIYSIRFRSDIVADRI